MEEEATYGFKLRIRVHDGRFRQDELTMASTKFDKSGFSAGTLILAMQKGWDQQFCAAQFRYLRS